MENKIGQDPKQSAYIIYILIGLVVLLIGSNIYFFLQRDKGEPKVVVQDTEKIKLKSELDSLESQIEEVNESKTKMSDELMAKNDSLKAKIQVLRAKLNRGKLTAAELTKAREDLKDLKSSVADYSTQIVALKRKNDSLTTVTDTLKSKLANVNQKASNLEKSNQDLGSKVKVASALKMANSSVATFKVRSSGKEVENDRASQVKKIKINFTIAGNPIAPKGKHSIYVQVVDPTGNVVDAPDSGNFTADGQDLKYTVNSTIDFNDDGSPYVLMWQNPAPFQKGAYTILLFADGYSMGKATFSLR